MMKKTKYSILAFLLSISTAHAANFQINYQDGPSEGFNDPTVVAPINGNTGTTLGQQRKNAIVAATRWWGDRIQSNVIIRVDAALNSLACNPNSGVLGAAGPAFIFIINNKWHPAALADSITNQNLQSKVDISTEFNVDVGSAGCLQSLSWYYGLDRKPGSQQLDFFSTLLHEIAHGLGMISLVGADGVRFQNRDDVFSSFLFDTSRNKSWSVMSNNERFSSARNNGNLVWRSNRIKSIASCRFNRGLNQDYPRLYAPTSYRPGSSVSHWDTAIGPDELMEPFDTPTNRSELTLTAFQDMGWRLTDQISSCTPIVPVSPKPEKPTKPGKPVGQGNIIPIMPVILN